MGLRLLSLGVLPAGDEPDPLPLLGTMTTLDDKLLGEKLQYYYSSSEDEDSDREDKDGGRGAPASSAMPAEAELAGEGVSVNTGTAAPWTLAGGFVLSVQSSSLGASACRAGTELCHRGRF